MSGFKKFILQGNLVDLAVAVIIGTSFGAVVSTFTNWLTAQLPESVENVFTNTPNSFGAFLNATISFLILATVVLLLRGHALHQGQGEVLPRPHGRGPRACRHRPARGDPRRDPRQGLSLRRAWGRCGEILPSHQPHAPPLHQVMQAGRHSSWCVRRAECDPTWLTRRSGSGRTRNLARIRVRS